MSEEDARMAGARHRNPPSTTSRASARSASAARPSPPSPPSRATLTTFDGWAARCRDRRDPLTGSQVSPAARDRGTTITVHELFERPAAQVPQSATPNRHRHPCTTPSCRAVRSRRAHGRMVLDLLPPLSTRASDLGDSAGPPRGVEAAIDETAVHGFVTEDSFGSRRSVLLRQRPGQGPRAHPRRQPRQRGLRLTVIPPSSSSSTSRPSPST